MNRAATRLFSTSVRRMALTQQQISIVKSTAPVLKEHGQTITSLFYTNMLRENPELKNIFNLRAQRSGAQPKALANAVLAYATHIDDLAQLKHAVERIAHKHASLFVEPAQYAIVGKYLMAAIGEVLGDALTPDIAAAWTAAYAQLADVFIRREAELYDANGSWKGWRRFRIARKVPETSTVTSFYLEPVVVDGGAAQTPAPPPLPTFLPGQYVSLQVPVPGLQGLLQSRQFSLSEAPPRAGESVPYYRISVQKETTIDGEGDKNVQNGAGAPAAGRPGQGLEPGSSSSSSSSVSSLLHDKYEVGDVVELSHPQGEFFVDPNDASKASVPLVLIAAGVGATPLVSILDATIAGSNTSAEASAANKNVPNGDTITQAQAQRRPTTWIQCGRSAASLCFADHARDVARRHDNVQAHFFVDAAGEGEVAGRDFDHESTLDLARLDGARHLFVDDARAEYFVCGPEPWMVAVRAELARMGVDWERMHLELFATGDVPGQ